MIGNVIHKVAVSFGSSKTWDEVAANSAAEQTVEVKGLLTTDIPGFPVKPTAQTGLGIVGVRISAADTLAITFMNTTGAGITPTAAQAYNIEITRAELPLRTDAVN
jgi:hypothetical protein